MKTYKTSVQKWDKVRRDYTEETTTAEILHKYSIYGREETCNAPLVLFAIGGREADGFCSNFDIYADKRGKLYSIPRPGSGCCGTMFGDCNHVRKLIKQGYFSSTLTDYGRQLMSV